MFDEANVEKMFENGNPFAGMDIISTYSLEQSLEDGMHVNIDHVSKQMGFAKLRTVVTRNLYEQHLNDDDPNLIIPKIKDLLLSLHEALRSMKKDDYFVAFKHNDVDVWAQIDALEIPTLTIMKPEDY